MSFRQIDSKELQMNPWKALDDDWMLLTAKKGDQVNTMTISWGGVGIMWHKPVVTCYVRPARYTKTFIDEAKTFTLSCFGGENKEALTYLGRHSGWEEPDKISRTDLHVTDINGAPAFEEAKIVFVCRVMYAQEFNAESFLDSEALKAYYQGDDMQTMYIAEIMEAYVAE